MEALLKLSAIAMTVVSLAGPASTDTDPRRIVIPIHADDVSAHIDQDSTIGQYYVVTYRLPQGLRGELEHALLELYFDVRADSLDGYVNEAPVLEVYAFETPYVGTIETGNLDVAYRAVRPVALGTARRVVLDITGIVRAHLSSVLPNNGLFVGSLAGYAWGEFRLAAGDLPAGTLGRVRIYTELRGR